MELTIIDNKGQKSGSVELDDAVMGTNGSKAVLHETVVAFLAGQRSGTHKTKTRTEVSGGGLKPWRQKGTGRARAGSTRSPLWRKGGIMHGPVPRDYSVAMPKKKRQLAFRLAFKGLVEDNRLQVVDPISITEAKTKHVAAVYKKWQAPTESLFLLEKIDPTFLQAARNIANVSVADVSTFNTYDCLRARRVFITKEALERLKARLAGSSEN